MVRIYCNKKMFPKNRFLCVLCVLCIGMYPFFVCLHVCLECAKHHLNQL